MLRRHHFAFPALVLLTCCPLVAVPERANVSGSFAKLDQMAAAGTRPPATSTSVPIRQLASSDPKLVAAACTEIADRKVVRAAAAVEEVLSRSTSPVVQNQCAASLARIAPVHAALVLLGIAADRRREASLRIAAIQATTLLPDPDTPSLTRLLEDPDPGVRTIASYVLCQMQVEAAVPAVRKMFEDADPNIREAAVTSASAWPKPFQTELLATAEGAQSAPENRIIALSAVDSSPSGEISPQQLQRVENLISQEEAPPWAPDPKKLLSAGGSARTPFSVALTQLRTASEHGSAPMLISRLSTLDRIISLTLCLFTLLMVIYPVARYLMTTWAFRREYLIGQLSGDSMKLYYEQFRAGATIDGKQVGDKSIPLDAYTQTFRADFEKWYGRRYYIVPVLGLAVLTAVCGWWGCLSLWGWISSGGSLESMRALVAASLAGALVWVISDEIDRLRRRDFTSFDVYYYVFRILIAVPFGWALTRLQVTLQVGIPVAFFLGAFPTSSLFTAARRIANQQLHLGEDPASGNLELEKLQSVGKDAAERFRDEGIYSISQLAYADPLDLTIRTNFDFNYVVDCVSQSLLWIYLGEKVKDLQPYSLRGAQEAAYFYHRLTGEAPDASAVAALEEIATVRLKMAKEALQCTLEQVAKDPYTEFLCNIWC